MVVSKQVKCAIRVMLSCIDEGETNQELSAVIRRSRRGIVGRVATGRVWAVIRVR